MERKSAVFSLTTSQVLIINMFENDVGRFQGANYGLLKTVFDVNLQLFQAIGSPKTLLLFVIRDQTLIPLEGHVETLTTDLNKIWSELSKVLPLAFISCRAMEVTILPPFFVVIVVVVADDDPS